ncbi:MAG: endolytic transglycosylase MltG [Candidatus Pacebacteria bacterium]|nr:endolytic transglycosylase MltG [Candidatus Paceibacterota bacterium]
MKYFRFTIISLVVLSGIASFFIWIGIYLPIDSNSKEEMVFSIKRGEGLNDISLNLEKEGILRRGCLFRLYVILTGKQSKLKAGNYILLKSMSIDEIADKFVLGDFIKNKVTIVEGWSLKDIADYLEEKGIIKKDDFIASAGSNNDLISKYSFLSDKPEGLSLEGYLFPDTYEIFEGETASEIIRDMLDNFNRKLTTEIKEEIKNQQKSIFDIVTMASMIEKEVITIEDKKVVSGILWKRLKTGMPLQVDATISYITDKKTTAISLSDLNIDSFYNTYKYKGLPIGPISNPGIESILAAVYPTESEYWYYLSTPEGETIFNKTLKEHELDRTK